MDRCIPRSLTRSILELLIIEDQESQDDHGHQREKEDREDQRKLRQGLAALAGPEPVQPHSADPNAK